MDLETELEEKTKRLREYERNASGEKDLDEIDEIAGEKPESPAKKELRRKIREAKQTLRTKERTVVAQQRLIRERKKELEGMEQRCEEVRNVVVAKKAAQLGKSAENPENDLEEEKRRYKKMILVQENKIKGMKLQVDELNFSLKQKDKVDATLSQPV